MTSGLPQSPPRPSDSAPPEALLYIEDGRVVHRVPVAERATIGSAADSHVTVALPGVQPLHAEIHWKGGAFRLVPRVTLPIWVSDRPVTSAVALAHGDRIRLGEATLLFVVPPEDNRTHHKTYLVVRRADGFVFHFAAQHARIRVGRTHGDLLVPDDTLPGRHFLIESWGPDAIYVVADREAAPLSLYGESLTRGCRRVWNGGVVTAGATQLAVYGRPREAMQPPPWVAAGTDAPAGAAAGGRFQQPTARRGRLPEDIVRPAAPAPARPLHALDTQLLNAGGTGPSPAVPPPGVAGSRRPGSPPVAGPGAAPAAPTRGGAPHGGSPVVAPATVPVPPQPAAPAAPRPPVRVGPPAPAAAPARLDEAITKETSVSAIVDAARELRAAAPPTDERPTSEVSLAAITDALRDAAGSPDRVQLARGQRGPGAEGPPDRRPIQDLLDTAFVSSADIPLGTPPRGVPLPPRAAPPPPAGAPPRLTMEMQRPPLEPRPAEPIEPAPPAEPRVASRFLHEGAAADEGRGGPDDRYTPSGGRGETNTARLRAKAKEKDDRYRP